MAIFGNITGPTYCLGFITVPVPGTPQPLSKNVSINAPASSSANPMPQSCGKLVFWAPPGNTAGKLVYVCFKGGSKAVANSIIFDFSPGTGFTLESPDKSSPFSLGDYLIDADQANDGIRVTAFMIG